MKEKIKFLIRGFASSILGSFALIASIVALVNCNSFKGYDAVYLFAMALMFFFLALTTFYEIGMWKQAFMEREKEGGENGQV